MGIECYFTLDNSHWLGQLSTNVKVKLSVAFIGFTIIYRAQYRTLSRIYVTQKQGSALRDLIVPNTS